MSGFAGKCARPGCQKHLKRCDIAVETKKIDGHSVIVQKRSALVCETHGVTVWDPPAVRQPNANPFQVYPQSVPATSGYSFAFPLIC